ncbi:sickle tail protein homolog isoform X3 [Brienomyrus brachyistius]|uniref:sickle tail protein homolog isoform X3 n=1 Tax=Brienomyrus brachyistius TaxID=42636 RepID=UPI0020B28159|nr:sickle tail protein homolog isoform X3 [Brienomyrus brachyistius]
MQCLSYRDPRTFEVQGASDISMQSSARRAFPPSRLLRPSSGGSASKLRSGAGIGFTKRPRALSLGERPTVDEPLSKRDMAPPTEGNLRTASLEQSAPPSRKQRFANGGSFVDAKPPHSIPCRRHTLGGRGPQEQAALKPPHMERKREAFLEHLKQKYPHHASTIMGHQDRLQDQNRIAQPTAGEPGSQLCAGSFDSLDAMSEGGEPPQAFTRGSRSRASLPVVRSTNQTKDRSLGVLYLQYGDETKQMRMPNEITSEDTIRALFVSAFPQHLSMEMLESPAVAVYVRDDGRNVYYEMDDVRVITDHSWLKIYHRDPGQVFTHGCRPSNGDARVQPVGREGLQVLRQQSLPTPIPAHSAHSSTSTSVTRIPFGPRSNTAPVLPRDRVPSTPPALPVQPCPSAILERRDVKPDEESETTLSTVPEGVEHPNCHHHRPLAGGSFLGQAVVPEAAEHPCLYRQRSRRYADSQLPSLGSRTPPASPHKAGDVRRLELHQPHQVGALERAAPSRQSLRRDSSMEGGVKSRTGMVAAPNCDHSVATVGDPQTRERMKAMEQQIASLTGLVQHALLIGPSPGTAKEINGEKPSKMASDVPSADGGGGSPISVTGSQGPLADAQATPTCPTHLRASLAVFSKSVSDLRLQLQDMRRLQLQNLESLKLMLRHAEQEISHKMAMVTRLPDEPVQRQRVLVEDERHRYLDVEESIQLQLGELDQYVGKLKRDPTTGSAQQPITLRDLDDTAARLQRVADALKVLQGEFPALQGRMRAVLRVEVEAVRFLKEEPHKLDSMLKKVRRLRETLGDLRSHVSGNHLEEPKVVGAHPVDVTMGITSEPLTDLKPPLPTVETLELTPPIITQQKPSQMATQGPPQPLVSQEAPQPITVKESHQPITVKESHQPITVKEIPQPITVKESPQPIVVLDVPRPPIDQDSQSPLPESQSSSVHSEVVPTSPVVIHRACSSPVQVQRSQQSVALSRLPSPPPTPPHSQDPQSQECSPKLERRGHYDRNGPIVQPRGSRNTAKSRALSIEAAKKEWAEHQRTSEFDKMLQEAQATMMMSIPSLEVAGKEEGPKATPLPSQEKTDTPQSVSSPADEATPLEPAVETPPETRGAQTPSKSPPPPPPRRSHPPSTGLTTGRSGEVIYTTRKESTTTPGAIEDASPPPVPKLNKTPPPPLTPPPIVASAIKEEEDDGDRIMAELQNVGLQCKEKEPETNESVPARHAPRVLYYVTGQISNQPPSPGADEPISRREGAAPASQVQSANAYRTSPGVRQSATAAEPLTENCGAQEDPIPDSHVPRGGVAENMPVQNVADKVLAPIHVQEGVPWAGAKVVREKLTVDQNASDILDVAAAEDQAVVLRSPKARVRLADEASMSPAPPSEESSPASDNIAFMITDTEVQALSCGEYEKIVNTKGGNVQTIKVGESREMTAEEESGLGKKPVIIIFDEPMDIRAAYNRLSTIFECEEELDRMLDDHKNTKMADELERRVVQVKSCVDEVQGTTQAAHPPNYRGSLKVTANSHSPPGEPSASADELDAEPVNDSKLDLKKKFKLKFPKKKLSALSQAIRTGTKTGKKTLQVVVYEDEEEPDGTVKQFKEAKRFEIGCKTVQEDRSTTITSSVRTEERQLTSSSFQHRMDGSEQKTSTRTDLQQQETSVSGLSPKAADGPGVEELKTCLVPSKDPVIKDGGQQGEGGVPLSCQVPKAPRHKRPKPQLHPRPAVIPRSATHSQQNGSPSASRTQATNNGKHRTQPTVAEKAGKPQALQDPQRQFRQANGGAKDTKAPSPAFPASKIPAFCPSSGKSSPPSTADSEATNLNPSPSSSKSSLPPPQAHRSLSSIPSPCNGSLHLSSPSLSSQSQNGRLPCSPSPVSPPSLGQGGRTIRTIHTPSFTSYKLQTGNGSKPTLAPASTSKTMV